MDGCQLYCVTSCARRMGRDGRWEIWDCRGTGIWCASHHQIDRWFHARNTRKNGATLNGCPYIFLLPETPPLLFTTQSSQSHGVQFGGSPPVFSHNGMPRATDVFHVRTLAGKTLVHIYLIESLYWDAINILIYICVK